MKQDRRIRMKILNMLWFKEENGSFSVLVNVLIPIYSSCSATPRCFVWFPYFLCPHVSLDLLLSPFFFPFLHFGNSTSSMLFSSILSSVQHLGTTCIQLFLCCLWPLGVSSMLWLTRLTLLASHREGVEVLMADLQVPTEEYSYGRSKIFIRNPRTVENTEK